MRKQILKIATAMLLYGNVAAQTITLDTSFDPADGPNKTVNTVVIQNDGKILIGGIFDQFNNGSYFPLSAVRLNTNGTLDNSFSPEDVLGSVYSIAIQDDGKILFLGAQRNGWPTNNSGVVRLNTDGSLDDSFDMDGSGFNNSVLNGVVQSDGKVIICGDFTYFNGSTSRNRIARLNADGSLDTSFDPGNGFNMRTNTLALQQDGKIIVGGLFTEFDGVTRNYIARLNTDGSLDASFDSGNEFTNDVRSIVIQADGKIICGGNLKENFPAGVIRPRIARLNIDGTLDTSFNPGNGFNAYPLSFYIQSNGKIIAGGDFSEYNGTEIRGIARLNTDGSLDTSFDLGAGFETDNPGLSFVKTIALQSDGKIIAGGNFHTYNGTQRIRIARLNGDEGTTSVDTIEDYLSFEVFPNPANEFVNISNPPKNATLRILDLTGKIMHEQLMLNDFESVNISGFTNGIYLVQIENNGSISNKKLIVNQ